MDRGRFNTESSQDADREFDSDPRESQVSELDRDPVSETNRETVSEPTPVRETVPEPKSAVANVTSTVSNTVSNVKEGLTDFFGSVSASSVFVGAVIAAVISLIVAYILYRLIRSRVSNRLSAIIPETKIPTVGTDFLQGNGSVIPASGNGKRMSVNFWIYIHDIDKYRGLYRHVFHRGDKTIGGASPTVFLDKDLNKLYVRFETTNKNTNNQPIKSMSKPYSTLTASPNNTTTAYDSQTNANKFFRTADTTDNITADLLTRGIAIDYIPLQRWVFVSVVVNEEVKRGSISAYIDGELVKTITSDNTVKLTGVKDGAGSSAETTFNYNFQNLMLDKGGDVWIGGNQIDTNIGPGFAGLVSSISFANYDMNAKDIYDVYTKGPIDNILAKMGLPAYGVRSPVYRIG